MTIHIKLDEPVTKKEQIEFIAKFIGGFPVCVNNSKHQAKLCAPLHSIKFSLSPDKKDILISQEDSAQEESPVKTIL